MNGTGVWPRPERLAADFPAFGNNVPSGSRKLSGLS